jgi:ribosomal protein S18 acetylase RimI-like enzyme
LASAADVPAIVAMYRHDGFPHAQGDPARAEGYFTMVRAAGGEVLVAVEGTDERAVVGHLELLLCDEPPPLGRYGHIETLEVREDRRRRGVGRALVDAALGLTRAYGGRRVEVWTGDDNLPAQRLYAATGFAAGTRMRDLELTVPGDAVGGAAPLGERLGAGERPWVRLRHVAGRQYAAPYCWWRAHLASGWGLPNADETGAWRAGSGAVVLADPWFVHLFLPPDMAPDDEASWPLWLAMLGLRAGRQDPVRTVVPLDLAQRWRLFERWPGRVVEDYTLFIQELGQ